VSDGLGILEQVIKENNVIIYRKGFLNGVKTVTENLINKFMEANIEPEKVKQMFIKDINLVAMGIVTKLEDELKDIDLSLPKIEPKKKAKKKQTKKKLTKKKSKKRGEV